MAFLVWILGLESADGCNPFPLILSGTMVFNKGFAHPLVTKKKARSNYPTIKNLDVTEKVWG
jgi:hypothetical protein